MINSSPVRIVPLDNGITLRFYDCSNRYYGDFHRALVKVEGRGAMDVSDLSDDLKNTAENLQDTLLYHRELERMGVSTERLGTTVCDLIDSFLASAKSYLERSDIPEQLLKKYQVEKGRKRRRFP